VEFRIPTSFELDSVIESADQNLTEAQASEVGDQALKMADDAVAFNAGISTSLSTDGLVGVIGEICRVEMKAMGITSSN
jgi:hypothetical protein